MFAASRAPAPVIRISSSLSESADPFLDHNDSRSGRPKNINVIDSKKLRRGMRAENRTLFLIPL
ncbi:hypothetical protein GOB49_12605 [Sinorhizobium meliloti]|nr:hypothetical protein [Sinorhizobium meliloti]MDW9618126.1 hypothetical protein [Sinorhizobium meliloti]MDW9630613.1 hypothetical protein [Sinorhizobium meliloti]MDX0155504.1 hypothetical protein [Sinorhizobium meliloti]MDX0176019.1 hypothetical protein [Sinorhizobium meliloti]